MRYLQVVRCTGGCGGECVAVGRQEVQVEAVVVGAGWAQGPGQTTCTNLTVTEDTACVCRPVKPACPLLVSWCGWYTRILLTSTRKIVDKTGCGTKQAAGVR